MDRDALIKVLESELEILNKQYELERIQAVRLLETARQSEHLGHNLGNRAAALSEIAGKMEQTQRILATVRAA